MQLVGGGSRLAQYSPSNLSMGSANLFALPWMPLYLSQVRKVCGKRCCSVSALHRCPFFISRVIWTKVPSSGSWPITLFRPYPCPYFTHAIGSFLHACGYSSIGLRYSLRHMRQLGRGFSPVGR